jgi:hypothetical protein
VERRPSVERRVLESRPGGHDSRHSLPLAPRLIIDYIYFRCRVGPLPFGEFIALWHAVDVVLHRGRL